MDEEIRQALTEVREMKQMCGNINMKLTNIVTQRGQDWKKKLGAEYQRGLDDAWKCARELYLNGACKDLFGEYFNTFIKNHTAQEAIEKLKAHKQDDKIEVGDEVIYNGTTKCLVVRPETNERYAVLIDGNGYHYSADHRECKKTGRHFDIDKILKEMQT